ncbi:phospholipid hydroperoxide glutathione peroxidase, mitochondrial [Sphaeroforma arctica JP610]|uniref:Phospholipid hydroperoxide glutathione peroxidase, mitochondrial n=1 Tax=Sphaeroforma arctica JP610 TaxID=667725 RepID=A0A0L0FSZ0_9EUKA|nr:phospholipid hydroperoxide glutathione peroxidase, mitochondrial [Sphaeroforma arctica JP610]KNC79932.1 phospholipid hydroperoxide glutathione peroxidase, mitochondrial [Sphaeroforma arctica JP610]|eukprot:XP_014153834.1 phospholipid hydroperoxide glutathione peroxidase, mitochondrial [Sphaeroforma arctica JP610]
MSKDAYQNVYSFTHKSIDGDEIPMETYKGNVIVAVNLEALDRQYRDKGLKILAFPCNQFGGQEPGSDAEIKKFASKFNVKFQLFSKIDVNGSSADPMWEYMKSQKSGIFGLKSIKWNFTKFLIDRDGKVVKRFGPKDDPNSMVPDIEKYL